MATLVYPATARQPLEELPATLQVAIRNLLALDTPKKRRERFPSLARRKRRGTREAPIRREQGEYPTASLEACQRDRRDDFVCAVLQQLVWALAHSDFRSGAVGDYREGKVHYLSRCNMADGVGFPVRIDEGEGRARRIRAYRLDHVIEQQIAAGLVFRHEEKRGAPLVHKIKPGVWAICRAALVRARAIAREKKEAREAARQARQREEDQIRGQEWPPEVRAIVGSLARARTNDTDPYANREPPVPKPKPPSM